MPLGALAVGHCWVHSGCRGDSHSLMHMLRRLFYIRARFGVALKAVHFPGRCQWRF